MKRILVSAAALAAALGVANAADMRPAALPAKAPAYVVPLFTWTGFYIGGNLGYGWGDGSGTVSFRGATGPISGDGDGILGGIQAGWNWQTGAFVFGVETDFQLSDGEGSFSGRAGRITFAGTNHNDWFGTIRGRLGYAVDRWLFYVTGGGAYTHNKIAGVNSLGATFDGSATGWAWTVGGGVEAALWDRWSVKAEYLYIDTPDKVPTVAGVTTGEVHSNLFRVGLNYRF